MFRWLIAPRVPALRPAVRWSLGPVTVLLAFPIASALIEQDMPYFAIFFMAVALTSCLAGRLPGLFAVVLSAVTANYFFITPVQHWSLSAPALTATAMFAFSAAFVAFVCGSFRQTALDLQRSLRERQKAESRLRVSGRLLADREERLHLAIDCAELGVFDLDPRSGKFVCSDLARRYFGLRSDAAVTYEAVAQAIHPDDRTRVLAMYDARHAEGEDCYSAEYRTIGIEDGQERCIQARGRWFFDEARLPVRLVGIMHEVTDQRAAERKVKKLDEDVRARAAEIDAERMRWRGVVEGIADEVWVCDAEGKMSLMNLPSVTAMGLSEFQNKSVMEVLDEVDILHLDGSPRAAEDSPLLRSLRDGVVVRGEEIMRLRKTGRERYRQFSSAPMRDASGAITGAVAIVRDVTDQKRVEQALRDSDEALREADRRKDEFLGVLSHELRNPLAPIRNAVYLLGRANATEDQARRARAVIERQTVHMAALVDELLDVTRIARAKVEVHPQVVDVRDEAVRTGEDHRDLMERRGIELKIELAPDPCCANADPVRLSQIIGNLLQNAAKFTPEGGRVVLAVTSSNGAVEISVRDSGVGIPASLLDHLFEPYTQGSQGLARTAGGLGLGLALVKGLADLHGGSATATSDGEGCGAEFVVRLPHVAPPAAPRAVEGRIDGPVARKRQVLVVDDNHDAAESLAQLVETFGHRTDVAFDGPSAIEKIRANPPDVVLCDIGLPGMSGYDVARILHEEHERGMRLVAVTGYTQPEDVKAAFDAGFDRHIAKPPRPDEIERLLAS